MRARALLLFRATTTMNLARRPPSSGAAATFRLHHQQQQPRRLLHFPPLAAAGADSDADRAARPASPTASPASYLAQSLHRERLAYQKRQQQQRRGLSSYPLDPPAERAESSATSTAAAAAAAEAAAAARRANSGSSTTTTSSSSTTSSVDEAAQQAASPSTVRPRPHHQARHYARLVRAFKRGRLGFGFSAGGLLFPYYAGVISEFRRLGIMPPCSSEEDNNDSNNGLANAPSAAPRPHLAGASAGALIAAVANAGVPLPVVEEACVELAADCLAYGTPGRLGPNLRALLEKHLPHDAHLRCRGNTHVAITKVVPVWRPMLVSDFKSREDLIEALMASAHIPLYLDGRWATRFRGQLVIDGGATIFVPTPPLRHRRRKQKEEGSLRSDLPRYFASEAEEARARREALERWEVEFDPDETEHEDDDDEDATASSGDGNNGNGNGSSDNHNTTKGSVDAVVKICCFPTWHIASLRTAAASVTPSLGAVAEALRADVSPDAFEPFPHDLATVARWALVASPRETFDFLLARGRRDASLFARKSGLEAAAAEARARATGGEAAAAREPAPPPAPEPPVAQDDDGAASAA